MRKSQFRLFKGPHELKSNGQALIGQVPDLRGLTYFPKKKFYSVAQISTEKMIQALNGNSTDKNDKSITKIKQKKNSSQPFNNDLKR